MEYNDQENDFKVEHSFLLSSEKITDEWKLRLSNRNHRSFRWRAIYALADNVETVTDWVNTNDTSVIISEPFRGMRRIRLVPTVKADDIIEAVVDLTYEGPGGYSKTFQEVFDPTNLRGRTLTINTLLDDPAKYRYSITIVRADGSFYESDEQESDLGVIIVDDKDGKVEKLTIKSLLDANQWKDLYAVELQIKGEDDNIESILLTEAQSADREFLMGFAMDAAIVYHWRTIAYPKTGIHKVSEFRTENDKQLVVTLN